jgi:hypothetical protein
VPARVAFRVIGQRKSSFIPPGDFMNTATPPLAQLVDVLPRWGWDALLAAGMLAPLVGLIISIALGYPARWKKTAVGLFYVISLPMFGLLLWSQTESPPLVCFFLLLLPGGALLGLFVLLPTRHGADGRGFEVQSDRNREDEAG